MAVSGFEGFEKRLELRFSGDGGNLGLRMLDFESLVTVLNAVQCTVVSAVGNRHFDAYVLSESSLFVYPTRIIVKTCGTTQLLKSVRPLIYYAGDLGLSLSYCRYTRGSFIFPASQPFPHASFADEVFSLEQNLPADLCYRKASVMPSNTAARSWHVFTAVDEAAPADGDLFTLEVCMTELDRASARKFYLGKSGDYAGKSMTELAGIDEINPGSIICDFAFDPCGYSMNGINGDRYSTIHVTPEDGFSYASFESVGSVFESGDEIARVLKTVVQVFRPAVMSVATTSTSSDVWRRVARAAEAAGMKWRSCAADEFPASGSVVFQTFTVRRK